MAHQILSNIREASALGNKLEHRLKEAQVTMDLLKALLVDSSSLE